MVSLYKIICKENIVKKIKILLLFLFCFIYLYTPPLLNVPIDIVIYFFFFLIFVLNIRKKYDSSYITFAKNSFYIIGLLFCYSLVLTVLNYPDYVGIMNLFPVQILRFAIEILFFPYIFIVYCKKVDSEFDIIEFLIKLAIIQGYFALFMFFIPPFKKFIFFNFLHFAANNRMLEPGIYLQRGFGIASEYLFAFPNFQALMLCIYIEKRDKKNILFFINIFALLISIVFNARSGMIFLILFFLYKVFMELKKLYNLKVSPLFLFFIIILLVLIPLLFNYLYTTLYESNESVRFLLRIFTGEYKEGFQLLLHDFLFLPEKASALPFGDGSYVFWAKRNSDIGYMQDFFFGGFCFCFIKYSFFIIIFLLTKKKVIMETKIKRIILLFIFYFMILHYKGDVMSANDFTKGLFLLIFGSLYTRQSNCMEINNEKNINYNCKLQ